MTPQDKVILKKLSLTTEWEMLKKLSDEMIKEVQSRTKLKDNEWDSLKSLIGDESEVKGLTRLIQRVHELAREAK